MKTPTTVGPLTSGSKVITVHPLKPDDSACITEVENLLRKVRHRQNVKRLEITTGVMSWIVTLTDREWLSILYEAPWFDLDLTAKKKYHVDSFGGMKKSLTPIYITPYMPKTTRTTRRLKQPKSSSRQKSPIHLNLYRSSRTLGLISSGPGITCS
jgi:hypothetical protein